MKLKEVPTRQVFRKEMKENTNARLHLTYLRTPFKHTRQQTKNKPRPHKMYQLFRQIYSSCDLGVQELPAHTPAVSHEVLDSSSLK